MVSFGNDKVWRWTRPNRPRSPRVYPRIYRWLLWAIAAAIVAIVPTWAVQALTFDQVDAVASQVTVVIAQGLQKGDIEARRAWNPGSGVLVARMGSTYYVLTALHVVRTRGVVYGIRTSDGEVHFIDDENDTSNILPLGNERDDLGMAIQGMDLALVKFTSDRPYPVAVMGDSSQLSAGDRLVVSGWPNPKTTSVRRDRVSSSGQLTAILPAPTPDGGYSVLYDSATQRGMSGGPVLNGSGELIGIHGRGRGEENGCNNGPDPIILNPQASPRRSPKADLPKPDLPKPDLPKPDLPPTDLPKPDQELATNVSNSCGMQTLHFLKAAESAKIALDYAQPPVDERLIASGLADRPKADTIENIYELFTFDVRSMLRDKPSGGCGSLLLGDPCQ